MKSDSAICPTAGMLISKLRMRHRTHAVFTGEVREFFGNYAFSADEIRSLHRRPEGVEHLRRNKDSLEK